MLSWMLAAAVRRIEIQRRRRCTAGAVGWIKIIRQGYDLDEVESNYQSVRDNEAGASEASHLSRWLFRGAEFVQDTERHYFRKCSASSTYIPAIKKYRILRSW
jgi:hypothetical protein